MTDKLREYKGMTSKEMLDLKIKNVLIFLETNKIDTLNIDAYEKLVNDWQITFDFKYVTELITLIAHNTDDYNITFDNMLVPVSVLRDSIGSHRFRLAQTLKRELSKYLLGTMSYTVNKALTVTALAARSRLELGVMKKTILNTIYAMGVLFDGDLSTYPNKDYTNADKFKFTMTMKDRYVDLYNEDTETDRLMKSLVLSFFHIEKHIDKTFVPSLKKNKSTMAVIRDSFDDTRDLVRFITLIKDTVEVDTRIIRSYNDGEIMAMVNNTLVTIFDKFAKSPEVKCINKALEIVHHTVKLNDNYYTKIIHNPSYFLDVVPKK